MDQQEKEEKRLQACNEHGRLTKEYDEKYQLHKTLIELARKAFEIKLNYPQLFIADEIHKSLSLPPQNVELRKKLNRFQKLLEQLKNRDSKKPAPKFDEEAFQQYQAKHKLKEFMMESIKNAYCVQSTNPLKFIAEMIQSQPDHKILLRKESEDLEKRAEIYTKLIQSLMKENPMNLQEIEEFSKKTVLEEHKAART